LPDGIFQTKNPNLGKFWRALEMENVGVFDGEFGIWHLLWPFGNVVVIW
jgi:hypothetical protein